VPGHPFIGSEGERGGQTGWGIRWPVVGRHYGHPIQWGGETKEVSGECGTVSGRGGDTRAAAHVLEAATAAFSWLHPGEGGSRVGPVQ
jgi:hypothetical protein